MHGPPYAIGDLTTDGWLVGCEDLRAAVERKRPRLHVFGHIHEAFGEHRDVDLPATRFLNVALCAFRTPGLRPPVVVEMPRRARRRAPSESGGPG
jgi:hypothetical protein